NNSSWPLPWTSLADSVALSDLQSNQARWKPRRSATGYTLGRMGATMGVSGDAGALGERDVEATFTVQFDDFINQGIGFYLRQNGGYCTTSNTAFCLPSPAGQGFAV